jgi:peptide/nickel transport system ATP-binding protein
MIAAQSPGAVLTARDLKVAFRHGGNWINALHGINLGVRRGEVLAVVGESGCGKSLTALALMGLLPEAARIVSGSIELAGKIVSSRPESEMQQIRGKSIAMIFQDPMSAFNPVLTVGAHLVEAISAHRSMRPSEARLEAIRLLSDVKLPAPQRSFDDYPHQLSGGMRQRAMIAIAMAHRPEVLIADEPTTALDASVQSEILDLLRTLQKETGMAIVLISHDLALVSRWADRVAVMYAGAIVEERPASELLQDPRHPYTRALLAAQPTRRPPQGKRQRLTELPGSVPALGYVHPGCTFAARCSVARNVCSQSVPLPSPVGKGIAACHSLSFDQISWVPVT